MLIFLKSVESELIYVENKEGHWTRVCDSIAMVQFNNCEAVLFAHWRKKPELIIEPLVDSVHVL